MSSVNEELSASKARVSPLEFRNTDLVSRLLAATPPYLYNMPMVPHSYFFSEMLRSLVQAKTDASARYGPNVHHHQHHPHQRRSRKRSWPTTHDIPIPNHRLDKRIDPSMNWLSHKAEKPSLERPLERPLELTINKLPISSSSSSSSHNNNNNCIDMPVDGSKVASAMADGRLPQEKAVGLEKPMEYIDMANGHHHHHHNHAGFPATLPTPQEVANQNNVILPPPPPMWYPPLYPTPYGIDPLHFFIDLRVSGHIYDRKNQKEASSSNALVPSTSQQYFNDILPSSSAEGAVNRLNGQTLEMSNSSLGKRSRHLSAFSVPNPSFAKQSPMNLSSNRHRSETKDDKKPVGKFDVRSLGFDKPCSKSTSTNYVMQNLGNIYKDIHSGREKNEVEEAKPEGGEAADEAEGDKEEDDADKEKKCKDLREVIGLELVVDYVKQEVKPSKLNPEAESPASEASSSSRCDTPNVEVVSLANGEM